MSLRKVDISWLMDAYEDTEFLPEEDMSVNIDKIKRKLQITVKEKHHAGRELILLAAALAACLALAGWAWGSGSISSYPGPLCPLGEIKPRARFR